jgi:hypothetical protein
LSRQRVASGVLSTRKRQPFKKRGRAAKECLNAEHPEKNHEKILKYPQNTREKGTPPSFGRGRYPEPKAKGKAPFLLIFFFFLCFKDP